MHNRTARVFLSNEIGWGRKGGKKEKFGGSYLVELIARLLMFRYLSISEFLAKQEGGGIVWNNNSRALFV